MGHTFLNVHIAPRIILIIHVMRCESTHKNTLYYARMIFIASQRNIFLLNSYVHMRDILNFY